MSDITNSFATPFLVFGIGQVLGGFLGLMVWFLHHQKRVKANTLEKIGENVNIEKDDNTETNYKSQPNNNHPLDKDYTQKQLDSSYTGSSTFLS